jgi:hypothetical protein
MDPAPGIPELARFSAFAVVLTPRKGAHHPAVIGCTAGLLIHSCCQQMRNPRDDSRLTTMG